MKNKRKKIAIISMGGTIDQEKKKHPETGEEIYVDSDRRAVDCMPERLDLVEITYVVC